MKLTKKQLFLFIIGFLLIATIIFAVSFAFFANNVSDKGKTDLDLTTGGSKRLIFEEGEPINLIVNSINQAEGEGSISSETISKVILRPGSETEEISSSYNVNFEVMDNNFIYTQDASKPELLLTIYDNLGNEVTEVAGLEHKTIIDAYTDETIKGFDITEIKNQIFNIKENISITAMPPAETVHEWTFKITHVNLETNQYLNEGKNIETRVLLNSANPEKYEFAYTGAEQSFTALEAGEYEIELWGAQGGTINEILSGGHGGYTKGTIYLEQGETLYLQVGGEGKPNTTMSGAKDPASAGYNGGGVSGTYGASIGGGGGGATDIRLVSGEWNDATSLRSRIMVASAGSGANGYENNITSQGSPAGGLIGYIGEFYRNSGSSAYINATGGTQLTAGYAGVGASSRNNTSGGFGYGGQGDYQYGSGGGSGYFGGGGAGINSNIVGTGASGSSYISGHTGCVAITGETNLTPIQITATTEEFPVRYIEIGQTERTNGWGGSHITELQAFDTLGTNIALNNTSITTNINTTLENLKIITDGIISASNYSVVGTDITIDLGQEYDLETIKLWRYFGGNETYFRTYVRVYNEDKSKSEYVHNYETDGTYAESSAGKTISLNFASKNQCVTGSNLLECSIHYSDKVFTDTIMIDGYGYNWLNYKEKLIQMPKPDGTYYDLETGHTGDGYAIITGPY